MVKNAILAAGFCAVARMDAYHGKWMEAEQWLQFVLHHYAPLKGLDIDVGKFNSAISRDAIFGSIIDNFTSQNITGIFRRTHSRID